MRQKLSYILYRIIKWFVWLFYPKIEVVGVENLPEEPVIVVGNHCQMNGPIISELYFPVERRTWCAGEMMHLKDVPDYAFHDFWSQKPRFWQPFYKLLSYIIAPFSVCIFTNAEVIGVYHDTRILTESDAEKQRRYIALVALAKRALEECIDLLGFEAPEKM